MRSSRRRQRRLDRHGDQGSLPPRGDSGQDDAFHLPGFYYDASQKRYFRLTPGQNRHNPLTLASIEAKLTDRKCREVVDASLRRSGNTSLPRSLSRMQTGQLLCGSLAASVQRARMASLRGTLQAQVDDGGECTFLSGQRESGPVVVGAWATETEDGRRGTILRSVDVGKCRTASLQTIAAHPRHKVVDISVYCRPDGTVYTVCAYVASDCMPGASSFAESRPVNGEGSVTSWPFTRDALRSCASAPGGQVHAVGLERNVQLLRLRETGSVASDVWTCCEDPLGLEFSEDSNLLFVGTHHGNVMCADLRHQPQSNHVYVIPLNRGVVSLRVMDSGCTLLASAYDGKLVLVDLRNQQVMQEFTGHCNNGLKIPLSYNASDRTVCSAGHDKVVRLWKVGEREPLTALKPGSGQHQPWPWYSTTLFCAVGDQCLTFS